MPWKDVRVGVPEGDGERSLVIYVYNALEITRCWLNKHGNDYQFCCNKYGNGTLILSSRGLTGIHFG